LSSLPKLLFKSPLFSNKFINERFHFLIQL